MLNMTTGLFITSELRPDLIKTGPIKGSEKMSASEKGVEKLEEKQTQEKLLEKSGEKGAEKQDSAVFSC